MDVPPPGGGAPAGKGTPTGTVGGGACILFIIQTLFQSKQTLLTLLSETHDVNLSLIHRENLKSFRLRRAEEDFLSGNSGLYLSSSLFLSKDVSS